MENTAKSFWYTLQVYSGTEESTLNALKRNIELQGLQDFFADFRVLVAEPDTKNPTNAKKTRSILPGYIFVKMVQTPKTHSVVSKTNKVVGFVGNKANPKHMTDEEFAKIEEEIKNKANKVVDTASFKVGDKVRITNGSFQDVVGLVNSIDESKSKLSVLVKIFDRETTIEINMNEVETVK